MSAAIAKKWAQVVREDILESSSKACVSLFTKIINTTPIDTGHAAGNWRTGASPPTSEIERNGRAAAIQEVNSVLSSNYFAANKLVYFYNNVDYAHGLEYGNPAYTNPAAPFSAQAPAGMVRINIKEALYE